MSCPNSNRLPSERRIEVKGIPEYVSESVGIKFRNRLEVAVRELLRASGLSEVSILVGTAPVFGTRPERQAAVPAPADFTSDRGGRAAPQGGAGTPSQRDPDELTIEERARQYQSQKPLFDFDFLIVPEELKETLLSAVDLIRLEEKVFDQWNLRRIEPFPRTSLNFHGRPGTGKTLAAHALARYLERPILLASYAQVESKFVGDGSKNVEAVFYAAERDQAILFIDEADSLLSRRLTNVTQGAEQAINSMRSQLLICLERFKGVVIFSTNLVENYDKAFETRVRNVYFPMPDLECRRKIWRNHLPPELPLAGDVSVELLAQWEDVCGRDIKNSVIDAALRAARSGRESLEMQDLVQALERIRLARIQLKPAAD